MTSLRLALLAFVALSAFASLSTFASQARAGASADGEPPEALLSSPLPSSQPTTRAWSVELAGQVAYTTPPIHGGTTPFGAGVGLRGGVVFEHLYLGLNGMAYLGGSDVDITDHSFLGGVEIGYGVSGDAFGGRLTLRPLVGIGGVMILHTDPSLTHPGPDVVTTASTQSVKSDTTSLENLYVEPAVMVMYSSGKVFAAAEANLLVIPGVSYSGDTTTWLSYGLQGQVGYRF